MCTDLPLGACTSEGYSYTVTVVGLCVCACVCVCLSGLNLLLQGSRATRFYTYMLFTVNARFYVCMESTKNVQVESYDDNFHGDPICHP